MSRSKAKFRWSDGEDEDDQLFAISRAQLKRDQEEWEVLILQIIELKPLSWRGLPLDKFQLEALLVLHGLSIKKRTAFKRQLGYTKGLFRGQELTGLRHALEEGLQHTPPAAHTNAEQWTAYLIADGDSALMDFVAAFEYGDREELRGLLRQALKDPKGKAPRRLHLALKRAIAPQA